MAQQSHRRLPMRRGALRVDHEPGLFERVLLPHVPEGVGSADHGPTGGKNEHLAWTRGAPSFFRSSNLAERGFCQDCGTPLTYAFDGTGRISVTINRLDDPEAMPPDKQYGIESKVSWFDGHPCLAGGAHRRVAEETRPPKW